MPYALSFIATVGLLYFGQFSLGFWLLDTHTQLTKLEKIVLGFLLSSSLLVAATVLLGSVFGPTAHWLLVIFALLGALKRTPLQKAILELKKSATKQVTPIALFFLATFALVSTVIFSGTHQRNGVWFQETHDNLWHVALTKSLQKSIPPAHPAHPAILLENYHYFYDLLLASYAATTQLPAHVLYFQIFSVVTAGVLIGSAFMCGRRIGGVFGGVLLMIFTAFVGGFAYLIPLFLPGQAWHESSFWVSQTFIMMVNPQIIYTLAGLYAVITLLWQQSVPIKHHLLVMALIAVSVGFKSYAWVVLTIFYGSYCALELLSAKTKTQKKQALLLGLALVGLSLPFLKLITGFKTGTFFYKPLWYIDTMIEAPDRLNYLPWKFEEAFYANKGNWLKVLQIKTQEIAIFFIGNLGVRSLFFLLPFVVLKKKLKSFELKLAVALIGAFLFAVIFPLLFLQTGVVWNSIQFWYYGLAIANILATLVVVRLLPSKKSSVFVKMAIITVILILGIPTFITAVSSKLSLKQELTQSQVTFLQSLNPSDIVLVCPENTALFNSALVSAYSSAQTFLVQPVQLSIVRADERIASDFLSIFATRNSDKLRQVLENNNISHALCSDPEYSSFLTQTTDELGLFKTIIKHDAWLVFTR